MQQIRDSVIAKKLDVDAKRYATGTEEKLFVEKLSIDENILLTLKQEILYMRNKDEEVNIKDYTKEDFKEQMQVDKNNKIKDIYIVDQKYANGKFKTYIYDETSDIVFKMPKTVIGGRTYHCYERAASSVGKKEKQPEKVKVEEESKVVKIGDVSYYSPNLKGFSLKNTYLVYYSEDFSKTIEKSVEEYFNANEPNTWVEDGKTYTLYDYQKQIWANIKTYANQIESYWVWIPRYAYKIDTSKKTINILYVDTQDNCLYVNTENSKHQDNEQLPEGYIVHPGFDKDGKKMYGIWMAKYEPSYIKNKTIDGNLAPDMSGFDVSNTYIELFNKQEGTFSEIKLGLADLKNVNKNKEWYDYQNQVWANIKTYAHGIEAWWVWAPRYAYRINQNGENNKFIDIIFVDLEDKPVNKDAYPDGLPEGYIVHPGFNKDGKKLKGIWMAKYEPSYIKNKTIDGNLAPDMSGFDVNNTYIELYNSDGTFTEKKLSEINLSTINKDKKWYDYQNQVWANIKTNANQIEAWWVWTPRYAYRINQNGENNKFIDIIFVDLEDNPVNKDAYPDGLPEGYIVHPGFNKGGKKLKGIWMAKYEPSTK